MFSLACAQPLGFAPGCALAQKSGQMVTVLELGLLRVLNRKNNEKALEFPVRAFSALMEFKQLTLEEIVEITELDSEIMQPIVKKLVKQHILLHKNGMLLINTNLCSLYKLIS